VRQAHDIFGEIVTLLGEGSDDAIVDAKLEHERFSQVLCKLTQTDDTDDLPDGLVQSAFEVADTDANLLIDLREFVMWYSKHRFYENLSCAHGEVQDVL